jgi:hypothetical protein
VAAKLIINSDSDKYTTQYIKNNQDILSSNRDEGNIISQQSTLMKRDQQPEMQLIQN